MSPRKELLGERFGKLVVVEWVAGARRDGAWRCRCDCGGERFATSNHLLTGRNTSCGCVRPQHGGKRTQAYRAWRAMHNRVAYDSNYSERGIVICDRWRSFEHFRSDMGEPPAGGTLERIDNDAGYEPGNCRWATRVEQARNTRRTLRIEFDGREQSLAAWAEEFGANYWTLYGRHKLGWSPERMFGDLVRPL